MTDRFSNMLRRKLTVDWERDKGELDMRYHSLGIGGIHPMPPPQNIVNPTAYLKPRLIRIFLQEFFYIYPEHGVFDWTKLDLYMDAVHAMGGGIMASICIKPKPLYPVVDEKIFMPNNIAEWQDVIAALVLRYSKDKPYVTHWAIANEMNIGEWGGCPYLIENPDDYFEYYKITAAPIFEALSKMGIKIGGPSYAGSRGADKYLGRFIELCRQNNVPVDFTCYNVYGDNSETIAAEGRAVRDAVSRQDPNVKLYLTEFNISLNEDLSLEEKAYDPRCPACLGSSLLAFHDEGCLEGSFQYHIYDQWCDPRDFAPWYERARYMARYWNDNINRIGLFDLDGKPRPQYFLYKMLYDMAGRRVNLEGTGVVLRGLASRNDNMLSMFFTNFATEQTPECVAQIHFENAPEGVYRLNVYRIDAETCARMKIAPMTELLPVESRIVYAHPDFCFDVFIPGDSAVLIKLEKQPEVNKIL
ncbi:MAG: hypothetical protein FWD23_13990 [Oscillospiraceae bacterium]|nr:hypothetical protein [Oscillospiraceae bacterium]